MGLQQSSYGVKALFGKSKKLIHSCKHVYLVKRQPPSNAQTRDDGAQLLAAMALRLVFRGGLNICIPSIDLSRSFSINLPLFTPLDSLLSAFMIMLVVLLLRS